MSKEYEAIIRLGSFAGVLGLMMYWEWLTPRRPLASSRRKRWAANLALAFINALTVRLLAPVGVAGIALLAERRQWGLFNHLAVPDWAAVAVSVVLLDFLVYLQHVLFHALPLLWRLHMVHHADLDVDATTGARFHTLEILISLGIKSAAVLLLGAPALAVVIFEVLLSATALFNHGNVRLPAWLDRLARLVLVTPDMHRIHHSMQPAETNSNFGFNLPWWDYLLGTYRAQPAQAHDRMTLGLPDVRGPEVERLDGMLLLPFSAGGAVEEGLSRRLP